MNMESKWTCGKDVETVLKIFAVFDLVSFIFWTFIYLAAGIVVLCHPDLDTMKPTLSLFGTEFDEELSVKENGWIDITAAILLFLLGVYLFWLIWTGIKTENYIKCRRWLVISVILMVISLLDLAWMIFTGRNVTSYIIEIVFIICYAYGLIIASIYLKILKTSITYSQSKLEMTTDAV